MVACLWILVGVGITFVLERQGISELGFLFNAAYVGGFAMAVYVPLRIYINLRFLPKAARPSLMCVVMMSVASIVYVGFALSCIAWEVTGRFGGIGN